ncbi:MAG: cysteine--tRNA ligase [Candidatus Marinimicrobia bacterium CG08_land_8_20_14_0_20_45_22]|nr:MAG: cysteine--tRNA ligase [Candidatus Marinimicrobia bacterium CG08_land_8_20_14_0_20_45_22]
MKTRFYNTLSRKKEDFYTIEPGVVRMYTCGPTVYNFAHIGNFRAYIFEDLLHRFLTFKGYRVIQVMNITDIDDKIIRDSQKVGKPIAEFTKPYTEAFFQDIDSLGIGRAEYYPAATAHIPEMVEMVKKLLANGAAYRTDDGSIYFKVSEFPKYGQLARLNVTEMIRGERVASDEYEKEEIRDFALWKGWKPEDGEAFWETELGKGRPGWHIECSSMSSKYLGTHFDVHTGGVDNIFPHHENEIAQSEAASGEKFVNFWLHCEHLLVDGKKMSKSLGNFIYLRQLLERGVDSTAIRLTLLSTHYRQKLNFSEEKLDMSAKMITRLRDFRKSLGDNLTAGAVQLSTIVSDARQKFESALDDDLNISEALSVVFTLMHEVNTFRQEASLSQADAKLIERFLMKIDEVLNIFSSKSESLTDEEQALLNQRTTARQNRDWKESDRLRALLLEKGIVIEDTPKGVVWKRKITT